MSSSSSPSTTIAASIIFATSSSVVVEGVGKMVGKSAAKGGSVAGGFVYGGSVIGLGLDVVVGLLLGSDDDVGFVVGIKLGLPVVGIDVYDIVGSNVGLDDVGLDVTGLVEGIFVVGMMGDFERSPLRHAPLVCPAYAELQHSS